MVGVITTLRRAILSSEQLAASKTHPEKIIERAFEFGGLDPLSDEIRRLLGDVIHFGYGASAGLALATVTHGGGVQPVKHGVMLGSALWVFGFNALLPGIGAGGGTWTWQRREFILTIPAHLAYGVGTAAALRLIRGR